MNTAAKRQSSRGQPWLKLGIFAAIFAAPLLSSARAEAQAEVVETAREASLEWDADEQKLYLGIGFRDVIDPSIQEKLSRGLPTTIVLTATLYRAATSAPLSTTAQTCKVTWHVWEEAYRVEVTRPGSNQVRWTTTIEGVLRRCAEAQRLLAGSRTQIPSGLALYATGKIQVNPISAEVLTKIKRWVMRPASTGTAAPGDALFSTFTGLFLQRIGDAEREVKFRTRALVPVVFHSLDERK